LLARGEGIDMSGVFISYRREDSRGFAGRIYDRLSDRLGGENVFFDVDNIAPGLDFVEVLTERVAACDALVAVIGRDWLASADKTGRRRLDNAEDFVRVEIEAALNRGVRVIPVLVEDAAMPQADELPESLRKLARRQGIAIDHARFNSDVERLIRVLSKIEEEAHRGSPPDAPAAASRSDAAPVEQAPAKPFDTTPARDAGGTSHAMARRWAAPLLFAAVAVVALLALGAILVLRGLASGPAPPSADVTHPSSLAAVGASSSAPVASDPAASGAPPLIADPSALLGPSGKLLNAAASVASPSDGAGKEATPEEMTPRMRELKALQKQVEEQLDRLNSPAYNGVGKDAAFADVTRKMQELSALQTQVDQELDGQNQAAMATIRKINRDAGPSAAPTKADAAPNSVAPPQQWLARADFDAKVKQQFAAGNYPDKAWGRCENGVQQAGAHWSPSPPGQRFSFYGVNDQDFAAKNAELVAKGYALQYDNTFPNCDGSTRHQALWMKGG
jgi:hypothetical protein